MDDGAAARVRCAAVFPGQGSQGPGMGVPWRGHPAWSLVEMAEAELRCDLSRMLLDPDAPPAGVFQTHVAVVLCSMMAWSSLRSGLRPMALAGHSLGLVTALHAAGVLSARDAITVVALRAEITRRAGQARPGGMAAVIADAGVAEAACAGADCWVANDNAPQQTVISGSPADLATAMAAAKSLGARDVIPLKIDGAFHSPLMRDAAAEFADGLADVSFAPLEAPLVHNGHRYPPAEPVPWARIVADDLVSPVRWRQTQLRLAELGVNALVEVGFGRTLTGIAKRALPGVLLHNAGSPGACPWAGEARVQGKETVTMTTENTTDVGQRVRGLLAKILNVDPSGLSPETPVGELGVDSLDIAELSALLAEEGIEFDKADARQAATLADLVAIARPR